MNYLRGDTVVTELNRQNSQSVTYTILINEMRLKIEHDTVTLMERRVCLHLEIIIVEWLGCHEHQ
jgi:hypothetical protein